MRRILIRLGLGKVLLAGGITVTGLSYPATLTCNLIHVDYTTILYTTVAVGMTLILWGMAKIFG